MPYLLDSDIVIDHLEQVQEVTALLDHLAPAGLAISVITYMERYQSRLRL